MFLKISNLTKVFDSRRAAAVSNFSLEIKRGELITLFGPSGCGKTTTLRMLAGLETPSAGEIFCEEKNITQMPAHKRDFAMVFQTPSLFPHLSIRDNIAYGLKLRKIPKTERDARVSEMLKMIQLEDLEKRFPSELSGGQQQRVALARALVISPKALLLDEPLANLDAQLREVLRADIRALQKKLGTTTIYVTHDETEARLISDRIVRMKDGKIISVDSI